MVDLAAHWPLVLRIADKLAGKMRGYWRAEELASFGFDGLRDAAHRFDPQRGSFEHYAAVRIRGAILDAVSRRSWHYLTATRGAALRAVPARSERLEERDEARAVLRQVGPRTRRYLELYYLQGWTLEEIGRLAGVSGSAVSHAMARARRRLQKAARQRASF
ncbi:MAG: hypothetical protein RLZZ246_1950 [Planctomycetota bacterium]|jgi:RNA polymerase sigma factor (sigma-70 family)